MRKLTVERLYSLKQYENFKLVDEIDLDSLALGKEVLSNSELYNLIRELQFLQLELSYRKYLELLQKLGELNLEDSIKYLTEQKTNTINLIKQIIVDNIKQEEIKND